MKSETIGVAEGLEHGKGCLILIKSDVQNKTSTLGRASTMAWEWGLEGELGRENLILFVENKAVFILWGSQVAHFYQDILIWSLECILFDNRCLTIEIIFKFKVSTCETKDFETISTM